MGGFLFFVRFVGFLFLSLLNFGKVRILEFILLFLWGLYVWEGLILKYV